MSTPPPTQTAVVGFLGRAVQDALSEATAAYWLRRARMFDRAAHRPAEDWPGHATMDQLDAQRARCLETAAACRARAQVELWP